jgi:putative transposase
MDGLGRALDNVFVERLGRTVKYGEVYLKTYHSQIEAYTSLDAYFRFSNEQRPHSAYGITHPKTFMEAYRPSIALAIKQ